MDKILLRINISFMHAEVYIESSKEVFEKVLLQIKSELKPNEKILVMCNPDSISFLDNISWNHDILTMIGWNSIDYSLGEFILSETDEKINIVTSKKISLEYGIKIEMFPSFENEISSIKHYEYNTLISNNIHPAAPPLRSESLKKR